MLVSRTHLYIVHSFKPHRLCDLVVLSPAILSKSHAKSLSIVYQLLQAVRSCHAAGVAVGELSAADVFIDEKLWVQLGLSHINEGFLVKGVAPCSTKSSSGLSSILDMFALEDIPSRSSTESGNGRFRYTEAVFAAVVKEHAQRPLPELTLDWMRGRLSNLDYLLLLNFLAGRRLNDPDHHPILPWVTDFGTRHSQLRDLSKSKYRLTKGDQQLDMTYGDGNADAVRLTQNGFLQGLIPHHVSDILSNITYYVYKARCTSKTVLTTHVRPKWEPLQYPASIERIYEWSPEECIPEFFLDADVFRSQHDDLCDLAVPEWAKSVEDFLERHLAVLESCEVSQNLHHWIDLNFGYKV